MTGQAKQAALVTGSSRGIGLAAALELGREGFNIAVNGPADDGELDAAARAVGDTGASVVKVPGDVAVVAGHDALLARAETQLGPLSTLVNNAGVSVLERGDLLDVTEQSYDRCMAVNAKAQFFLSQAFARRLVGRERGDGRFYSIVSVTSCNAVAVSEQRAEYCASKAAAAMTAKAFAVRLGREGVAVYDVQPGLVETDMTRPVIDSYRRRSTEEGLTLIPRLGQPEDMGRIIASLATGRLPYTTGLVICADAGLLVSRF